MSTPAPTNMTTSEFNLMPSIYVAKETEAEAILSRGVCETVHGETGWGAVESVTYSSICLVVVDGAPVVWFLIGHRCVGRIIDGYIIQSVYNENRQKQTVN